MGKLITFDSPWEEIRDAARSACWSRTPLERPSGLTRDALTEADFNRLAGIPVLLVADDDLPPHPRNYRQISFGSTQYNEMMQQRIQAVQELVDGAGAVFNSHSAPAVVECIANVCRSYAFVSSNFLDPSDPHAPVRRAQPDLSLSSALPHRLDGNTIPASAVVMTNSEFDIHPSLIHCAERQLWLPPDDYKMMCDLHELTHLLQLTHEHAADPLTARAICERDAENNGLALYQQACGGPPTMAAAAIMSHVSYVMESDPSYRYLPGVALEQTYQTAINIDALRAAALYVYANQRIPAWDKLQDWGRFQCHLLPPEEMQARSEQLDDGILLAQTFTQLHGKKKSFESSLLGLRLMATREFEMVPEEIRPIARQITDAATFTNPTLMGSDPVKPRVTLCLQAKNNSVSPA